MKIILINRKHGGARSIELGRWSRALLSLCCLGLPLGLVAAGYQAGQQDSASALGDVSLENMQEELEQQSGELLALRQEAQRRLQALTLTLAELQARVVRLDALGEHLTDVAGLDDGEFDFSSVPPVGGPLAIEGSASFSVLDLDQELDAFAARLDDREQQLDILGSMLNDRYLDEQSRLSGRPVEWGWISSGYGVRTDPFTGQSAMHHGLDFAGKEGANVVAVAAGVVTWTGERSGYGSVIEVSHGDGYMTRYAHNKQNLVAPGDLVKKGEPIALMGTTGRSTGPHVHFEVYKHGRQVDPSSYVRRNRR
jgi:murein DD-endopeptidase MepM/ murein hydrolase activator NlpD